jgi:hypothetical protein
MAHLSVSEVTQSHSAKKWSDRRLSSYPDFIDRNLLGVQKQSSNINS